MTPDKLAEEYFRWRLEQMKAEAPAAPSAAELIERALPWWERFPERLNSLLGRLATIRSSYDHNGGHPNSNSHDHVVPALIVRGEAETNGLARVLDFRIHDGKLHFRFQLEPPLSPGTLTLEVTFISDSPARPVCFAPAYGSEPVGYIVYTELEPHLVREWASLNDMDRLPFELILRLGP